MRLVRPRVQTGEQYASGATFPERAAQPLSARASLPLAGWYIAIGPSGALPPQGLRPIIALGQVGRGDLRECVVPFSWAQGVADHACKRIVHASAFGRSYWLRQVSLVSCSYRLFGTAWWPEGIRVCARIVEEHPALLPHFPLLHFPPPTYPFHHFSSLSTMSSVAEKVAALRAAPLQVDRIKILSDDKDVSTRTPPAISQSRSNVTPLRSSFSISSTARRRRVLVVALSVLLLATSLLSSTTVSVMICLAVSPPD